MFSLSFAMRLFGLRIAAQKGWAPGNTPAIPIPVVIPPGSGTTLSERDRRLAARHAERRRRNSYGLQEGPAEKGFKEREQERQAFEQGKASTKQSGNIRQRKSSADQGSLREPTPQTPWRPAIPPSARDGGAVGHSLASALDQKVAAKSAREAGSSSSEEPRVHFQDIHLTQDAPTQNLAPAVANHPSADYVKQQREQMRADDLAAARREQDPERLPPATSTAPSGQQHSQPCSHGAREGAEAAVPSAADRKAEYARQLREQMAANKAMKSAVETARKRTALPASSGVLSASGAQGEWPRGCGSERMGGPVRNAKEEYARQLREQMAAKEDAQRAAKGLGVGSSSSHAGPSWIEGATEGREARRKRSNEEYAYQLRAQIAAQKGNIPAEHGRIAPWGQPPTDGFRQQQGWPGGAGRMEDNRGGPEWQSQGGGRRSSEEESSHGRLEGGRTVTPPRGETHDALALERLKRVNHQREYAEALRRDMATPKVDSLGRPIEDITSPSRARLRSAHHNKRSSDHPGNGLYDRGSRNSGSHESRDDEWDGGRRRYVEGRREGWRLGYPTPEAGGDAARQEHRSPTKTSASGAVGGGWREEDGGDYSSGRNHNDQQWERRGEHEYRYSGPGAPPGGVPTAGLGVGARAGAGAGAGVGVGVVSTKASNMHNPVDSEELAKIQAKKDSYRRDLEAQMAEHKKLVDQRKRGAPGSKEAEVFHLQEAMEERNERNKMAPGYELGPLGVAVMKANYSTTGRGQRSPPRVRAALPDPAPGRPSAPSAVETSNSAGGSVYPANNNLPAREEGKRSSSLPAPSADGAGGMGAEGAGVPPKRGSGLRDLLGTETNVERDRERSKVQAEALKKQVEDNKTRRDIERAQRELDERKEELRLQKEREQLHERYEQEGRLAKALESEKLLKEAEEARLAHAARKEKEAAEAREKEKQEDARVEREQRELEKKYARERAAEEPLGQASAGPPKPMLPEFPEKKPVAAAAANSPRPDKTPREIEAPLIETPSSYVDHPAATAAAPTCSLPESPAKRDTPRPPPASGKDLPTTSETVSIEKLRAELWKQKQLTEVLRHEVGQQESERRKLLDIARCAKESEAAALKAAFERRGSQRLATRDLGKAGGAAEGHELWRVPPPPMMEGADGQGAASSPEALGRAESADAAARPSNREHGGDNKFEMEGTAEDRLLLAGLRRLGDHDRTPRGRSGSASSRKDDLGGDSTFREQVPGARAWSSGMASTSGGGGDNKALLSRYHPLSSGGIRAETRYVFPDGSVRRHVETPVASGRAAPGSGGVPMPLVGTSRVASADLSLALGIDALSGGDARCAGRDGGGGGGGGGDCSIGDSADQRRCMERIEDRGRRDNGGNDGNGGAYRGPGAAPGAEWAPGGRPPRAFVPFLNLPASSGSATSGSKGKWRRRKHGHGGGGSVSGGRTPPLPPVHSSAEKRRNASRARPLVGVGGVPISPGRAMLTGPGRPGTGASSSSRMTFGDTDSGNGRRRRPRRRLGGRGGGGGGGGGGNTPMGDGELSDGGDSVGSGSTDVEFLRRRAEAKLRSLDRQEAEDLAAEEELDLLHSSSARRTGGVAAARAPTSQSEVWGGRSAAAPTNKHPRRVFSTASSSSRSFLYSGREKRPDTNHSESSMLGDSRWATLEPH
eukprot:g11397.t2